MSSEPRLKVGNIIEVHGWVMLRSLESGRYRVTRISTRYGMKVYWFSKPKGKREIVGHYCHDVDSSITDNCLNHIEIIS